MRNVGVVLAQVVVALLLAGLIAPAILAAIPALTEHGSGMWAILVLVLVFKPAGLFGRMAPTKS